MTTMRFGAHVSAAGGAHKAVERAAAIGADGVQLFLQSPRMWKPREISDEEVEAFHSGMEEHGLAGAVAHAIYLINVASDKDDLYAKSRDTLAWSLEAGGRLGLDAVIFHPGSHKGAESGLDGCIDRIADAMRHAVEQADDTWLLVENSAGAGGTVGRDVDELVRIVQAVDHPRVGVCLDTCHWYVSGIDVTDRAVVDARLDELDAGIGLDRLRALHLNDALTELGSNRDRHANIGTGEIGDGLGVMLGHPKLQHLVAYLETPGHGDGPDEDELAAARRIRDAALATA